jgi:broad specificity phosphatase PhoE
LTDYGDATIDLLERTYARGASHALALIRHSAREYEPGRHDLDNPLTDEGREYARRLGMRLPKALMLRGYASPPQRCMETAELVLDSHRQGGGGVTRHRPVEALGVFYALDQRKMWKGMVDAGGLVAYLQSWFAGEVPSDAMMEPTLAANQVIRALTGKLDQPVAAQQLDLCVSHDITLHLVRDRLLGEAVDSSPVAYLDALVLFRLGDELRLASQRGSEVLLQEG